MTREIQAPSWPVRTPPEGQAGRSDQVQREPLSTVDDRRFQVPVASLLSILPIINNTVVCKVCSSSSSSTYKLRSDGPWGKTLPKMSRAGPSKRGGGDGIDKQAKKVKAAEVQ